MTEYRVIERPDGWIVEILDGIPALLEGARVITPEWVKASDPFPTREEAEHELKRLANK